jgi:hypothetical protein
MRLRIGICGAPEVGKSELASRLRVRLAELASTTRVIDGYVSVLEERTGLAYGVWADYTRNLQVALERYTVETAFDNHFAEDSRITVGTVIDTIMHAALYADSAISVADRQASYARASTTMHALGMLVNDTWSYDYCFWLRQPDASPHDHSFAAVYDRELATVIESFTAPVVALDQPTIEANVELAYGVIEAIERDKQNESTEKAPSLAEVVERGVRDSGETGPADGDAAGRVPDVPRDED